MIVEMSKVQVLGPRRQLPEALRFLHEQGVLHLRPLPEALAQGVEVRKIPLAGTERAGEQSLEEIARRLHELLLVLPVQSSTPPPILPHVGGRDGVTEDRPREGGAGDAGATGELPDVADAGFPEALAAVEAEIRALNDRRLALLEERDLLARYERLLTVLVPLLRELEGATHLETMGMLVRRDRPEALALLERETDRLTRGAYTLLSRNVDPAQVGVLLTVPRDLARQVSRLLVEQGIAEMRLPERYAGQPFVETLGVLLRRGRELPGEIAAVQAGLDACARRWSEPLRQARRTALDRLARLRAVADCGETTHAFVIWGWVPTERYASLSSALEEAFGGRITLAEHAIRREEHEQVPVVLRNPPAVAPFELLLSLLPPPRYGSVDPTPLLAGFFPFFWGLMLGDVGYGAVALALALLARAKHWGGETGRQVAWIAAACSLSAIAFGFLFGELFGDLGGRIGLHPLLLDRREAVLSFLGLALGVGAVHVVLGLLLGLWTALRNGERTEAAARAATLVTIAAVVLALLAAAGAAPRAAGTAALAALGPLLAVLVAVEGLPAPLEVLKTLGNVLSYARLMALGLASVMLAEVANQIGGLFTVALAGAVAAALLHAVNLALGFVSPVVQALRLHYVEFFGKFYRDGGKPYAPFSLTP